MDIPRDWTFKNSHVVGEFDRHVREQLPWYDLATGIVAHIARHYVPDSGGVVYDIGASTGNIGRAMQETIAARNARFIAIDNSPQMVLRYAGPGEMVCGKVPGVAIEPFDLAVCFLVLMFMSAEDRYQCLSTLRAAAKPGGAIVVFDKCEPLPGYVGTIMWRLTIAGKLAAGVDPSAIIEKEVSLGGIQRPIKPASLQPCTEIFRFGDFAGWIIET